MASPRQCRHAITVAMLASVVAVAGCGDAESRDAAAARTGDMDLSMLQSDTMALAVLEHPVEFELGEPELEQLLTARERLRPVSAPEAERALGVDVRQLPPGETVGAVGTMVDELQRSPETRRAVEGSGLSMRDYVSGMLALQQAVLARGVDARGALPPVMLANVQVVERNPDRVAQLTEGTSFASVLDGRAWERTAPDESMLTGLSPSGTSPGALGPASARSGATAAAQPAEAAIWHTGGQDGGRVSVREMERRKKEAKKRQKDARKREKERRTRGRDN